MSGKRTRESVNASGSATIALVARVLGDEVTEMQSVCNQDRRCRISARLDELVDAMVTGVSADRLAEFLMAPPDVHNGSNCDEPISRTTAGFLPGCHRA